VWQVAIHPDFKATANFCPNGDMTKCGKENTAGTWMTYYDQGLALMIEPNLRFVTNFRYNLKQNITKDPLKEKFENFN
jgi:hypothetical protein